MVLELSQLVGILKQHALDELIDCILRVVDELLGRRHGGCGVVKISCGPGVVSCLGIYRGDLAMTWRRRRAVWRKPPQPY